MIAVRKGQEDVVRQLLRQGDVSLDSKLGAVRLATVAGHGVVVALLKKAIETERFSRGKHRLAVEFLREIDDTVADGKLAAKTASAGGCSDYLDQEISDHRKASN